MKVGDAPKSAAPQRPERVKSARRGGEASAASPPSPVDEISLFGVPEAELTPRVRAALTLLLDEIQTLRAELQKTRKRMDDLETLADRDPLLDILNRRAFACEIERGLSMIDRYSMRASLIFIDLNDLKTINDTKGHGAGDAALAHVARALQSNVRQTDAIGRLGGDEFGVLLIEADNTPAARKAEELARHIAETPVAWKEERFTATISWGSVEIGAGSSARDALAAADSAMYAAKRKK